MPRMAFAPRNPLPAPKPKVAAVVNGNDVPWVDPNTSNIVADVSPTEPEWIRGDGSARCVLVDLGAKHNIIRRLTAKGFDVLRVPWNYDWTGEDVDGVVLSNGPGNPKLCTEAIEILKKGLERDIPIFGICLGNQLLALAAGGEFLRFLGARRSSAPDAYPTRRIVRRLLLAAITIVVLLGLHGLYRLVVLPIIPEAVVVPALLAQQSFILLRLLARAGRLSGLVDLTRSYELRG